MKKLIWNLLEIFDKNRGYSTPIQKRFIPGDMCRVSNFKLVDTSLKVGELVTVVENSRHDYLVMTLGGEKSVVYQFELELI
jgi:hypothetical protein